MRQSKKQLKKEVRDLRQIVRAHIVYIHRLDEDMRRLQLSPITLETEPFIQYTKGGLQQ
jgi:hypothetical protein